MSAGPVTPPSLPRGDLRRGHRITPAGLVERQMPPVLSRQMSKMLPNQNHPLTRAYMVGARSTTQSAYTEALRLIRACEGSADQLTIDQCKLAAEVLIERKMP